MKEGSLFGKNNLYNDTIEEICSKNINKSVRRWIIIMTLIIASFVLGLVYPTYVWYRDGIFYTVAGVLIPFVEPNSNLDITLNLIYQTLIGYNAINGIMMIHIYNALFMNSVELSTDICINDMKNLSARLDGQNTIEALIGQYMTKIFQQIQKIDR